jgi:hypothetical protein
LNGNPKKNKEGYSDPTTYHALRNIEEGERVTKLIRTISYICGLAGYTVENRIILRDKKTGKVWK